MEDDGFKDGLYAEDGLVNEITVDEDVAEEVVLDKSISLWDNLEVDEYFWYDVAKEDDLMVEEDDLVTAAGRVDCSPMDTGWFNCSAIED